MPKFHPHVLRDYALVADGERGALVSPRGDIVWMCAPRWDSDAVFASLIGGDGVYAVTPARTFVWGGYYEEGTLIWHSRWITAAGVTECHEALTFPGEPGRVVLLRQIVARGVLYAADHPRRRQYWVGATTAATVLANKFVPALLDRYLARTGYDSQQTGENVDGRRPDNLYQPVDGQDGRDHGAHGIFDARSHARSVQLWLDQRPRVLSDLAAGAAIAGGVAAARRARHR